MLTYPYTASSNKKESILTVFTASHCLSECCSVTAPPAEGVTPPQHFAWEVSAVVASTHNTRWSNNTQRSTKSTKTSLKVCQRSPLHWCRLPPWRNVSAITAATHTTQQPTHTHIHTGFLLTVSHVAHMMTPTLHHVTSSPFIMSLTVNYLRCLLLTFSVSSQVLNVRVSVIWQPSHRDEFPLRGLCRRKLIAGTAQI